jgi:hypothetical protein
MDKTPYSPIVLLRCNKCHNTTPHVLISFSNNPALAINMVYECQTCGENKKVYDLNPLPQVAWEPVSNIRVPEKQEKEAKEEKPKEEEEPKKEPTIPIDKGPQIEQTAS